MHRVPRYVARRFSSGAPTMVQEAALDAAADAEAEARSKHDASRGPLEPLLWLTARHRVARAVHLESRRPDRYELLAEPLCASRENEAETRELLNVVKRTVSRYEWLLLELRFLEGWTLQEIADTFRISRSGLKKFMLRLLARVREACVLLDSPPAIRSKRTS